MRSIIIATIACAVIMPFARPAAADEFDKKTILTFSGPVEIPGRVLPAGTYVFKLMNSPADRHIVQVYNDKENQLIATLLAVPDERLKATGKTVIDFSERPTGSPEAVQAWFYPGDTVGQEFVYPHNRARELARQSGQHVLSMRDESVSNPQGADVKAIQPSGEEVDLNTVHHH